jgi:RNA polymerase sigma factor (sigma-70 family)
MTRTADYDSIPTRHSLLARMKNWEDQQSWQDFFNTYWKLIYSVARQSGLAHEESEEVVQETVLAVAKKMGEFKNDPAFGSFKSWLLLITRRRIADQFRKRPPFQQPFQRPDETRGTRLEERIPDPASGNLDAVWNLEWEKNLLAVAMDNVKQRVSPKQFLVFYQQTVNDWSARKVAQKYGLNLAQIYMAKYRISSLIKKEVRRLQQKMNG